MHTITNTVIRNGSYYYNLRNMWLNTVLLFVSSDKTMTAISPALSAPCDPAQNTRRQQTVA